MRFKLIRWTRQLRILLGGRKPMEAHHFLFYLAKPLTPKQIWKIMWPHGWGYNALSHTFKGQIITLRKPVPPRHQYHLRFYKGGAVSGHFEVDPVQFPLEHLDGVDLRPLTEEEKLEIWGCFHQLEYVDEVGSGRSTEWWRSDENR